MTKSAFVRARVEPDLKNAAEEVLSELGISPTQAIIMLYKRVARDHEWPLELKIPNAETQKAMNDTRNDIDMTECDDLDDLFKKLEI